MSNPADTDYLSDSIYLLHMHLESLKIQLNLSKVGWIPQVKACIIYLIINIYKITL